MFDDRPEHPLTKRGEPQGVTAGGSVSGHKPKRTTAATPQPAWAKGLQRLYDQVVEESLPDDLAQLLDKLDRASDGS
ncbi:MAG: NepR family anti-sigma factor [Novosphingobium sp.]